QNSCVMHCIPCHAHCSFALAYRKAQPFAVAHPLLQLQDGDTFEQMGNAFPIDPVPSNIAYLKKAIKAEKPNKVKCDADEIFSQQDGKWIKEEKMSASLRDTDETDCYGFTLPSA
ncbi:Ubiquitin-like domain-containing protein, partial [Durusdinium trenchii]